MVDRKSKEESAKKQGEAQVDHGASAPDKHMETEGLLAQNNPAGAARAAEDQELRKDLEPGGDASGD